MEGTELMKANSTQIIHSVDDLGRIGKMMAISGYFQDARDAAQASVKIMAGMEMGFGPFTSMTGIYIIKGNPSVSANLMASAVKSNPRYDYRVQKMEDNEVAVEFFERIDGKWNSLGTSKFTEDDAKRAGTQNMGKFPRNMLFARSISNGIRWFCPDVFNGNAAYTPDELGAIVDDDGNVTEMPTIEKTETVIEGVIKPVEEEQHTETPRKKDFDEIGFLRDWNEKVTVIIGNTQKTLPYISLEGACDIDTQNKDGTIVKMGRRGVGELAGMWKAYKKRLEDPNANEEDVLTRLSAVNQILTAKSKAQAELDKKS